MCYGCQGDELQLNAGRLKFAKKVRGKKVMTEECFSIPTKLIRRHCFGKVAEVYELSGRFTPIIAHTKLDLHELVCRQLTWDDVIPDDLRDIWVSHMEMKKEIAKIRFNRAVVSADAVSINLDTIDFGDASKSMVCIAIYVRFLRRRGEYSSQLIFGRSKRVPDGMTQPCAATVNTLAGEAVQRILRKFHKSSVKLIDSKITLHWINNKNIPLKP